MHFDAHRYPPICIDLNVGATSASLQARPGLLSSHFQTALRQDEVPLAIFTLGHQANAA